MQNGRRRGLKSLSETINLRAICCDTAEFERSKQNEIEIANRIEAAKHLNKKKQKLVWDKPGLLSGDKRSPMSCEQVDYFTYLSTYLKPKWKHNVSIVCSDNLIVA